MSLSRVTAGPAQIGRNSLSELYPIDWRFFAHPEIEHGARVGIATIRDEKVKMVVHEGDPVASSMTSTGFDSVITDEVGLTLVLCTADCAPVFFIDTAHNAIGLAHVGLAGACLGISSQTVLAMIVAFGSRPEDINVSIGPCISGKYFNIETSGMWRRTLEPLGFRSKLDSDTFRVDKDGLFFDLDKCIRTDLERIGVSAFKVESSQLCTVGRHDEFYSHYLTGNESVVRQNEEGRFMSFIGLKNE
jgi:YfiH family protein